MKKRRSIKRLSFWLIIASVVFLFPLISLMGPDRLRQGMIRQLTYKVMAEKITEGAPNQSEKALRVFNYVHQHFYTPPRNKPAGKSVLEVMLRNVAWCDQQADIMAVLARRFSMNGGRVFLYGFEDVSNHTVCVLSVDGRYRVFDPLNGYVFYNQKNEVATLEEIQGNTKLIRSDQFDAVRQFKGEIVDDYFMLYAPEHPWIIKVPRTPIWLKYIDYYYDLFGDFFLRIYQDLYFKADRTDRFKKARLKHLSFRFESAIQDYSSIIDNGEVIQSDILLIDYDRITRDIMRAETMFFKGQAQWDMEEYDACIMTLERYLADYPDNRWKELAYFYLGDSFEKQDDIETAILYYKKIKGKLWQTPAPARLMKLMKRKTRA